jgi:hypothetical protein
MLLLPPLPLLFPRFSARVEAPNGQSAPICMRVHQGRACRARWLAHVPAAFCERRGPGTRPARSIAMFQWSLALYSTIAKGLVKMFTPCSAQAGRGARLPPAWRGPRLSLPNPRRACALQGGRLRQPLCGGP